MTERPFDLVLFGATGFTGRLVAQALASRAKGVTWALAGRSISKLRAVRDAVSSGLPELAELPLLVADASDERSLAEVAGKTRVVCTTVGPYAKHGAPLVAACTAAGTDYCDLTGEPAFVRAMIDAHHARAEETGARIVHCCGFDSIPSDIGVLVLSDGMARLGKKLEHAKLVVQSAKGGASGGTAASMLAAMEQVRHDRKTLTLVLDPYSLSPDGRGKDGRDQLGVVFDRDLGRWTAPFVMAMINARVVRRTNALLGFPYGRDFRYEEVIGLASGPRGLLVGLAVVASMGALATLAYLDVTRPLLAHFLPAPGTGPSEEVRRKGRFEVAIHGTAHGERTPSVVCRVRGDGDPGYDATARMLAEVARLLVETSRPGKRGGVLTPASALGLPLADHLREVGIRFDVEQTVAPRAEGSAR